MAREFLTWLDVAPRSRWIDVGCGTGALTEAIAGEADPSLLAGVDPSPGFVETARHRLAERADLRIGDARELPFQKGEFDATVSGLVLNFVPDPLAAVREMKRVTRDGGTVAIYLWDYASGMQMIRIFWDVAVALDPSVANLDEATRFPLCHPEAMEQLFTEASLGEVETTGLEIATVFDGFDDFWRPLLGGQGPIPTYVSSLDQDDREALRAELETRLPVVDGSVSLTARAWAVSAVG